MQASRSYADVLEVLIRQLDGGKQIGKMEVFVRPAG